MLSLHLYPSGHALPDGAAISGSEATLTLQSDRADLHVALPNRSRAEQRWIVDRSLRKLAALVDLDRAVLNAASGVPDDTALTIALDLFNRTDGAVEVASHLERAMRCAGGYERAFRSWVNEEPTSRTSLAIAADVEKLASGRDDLEVEVLDEAALTERGLRLLLAVGRGSQVSPPRLVLARYRPGDPAPLLLLGKGVTFDTGGINLKPYEAFVSAMKNDMAGAALAFHLFRALVESGYERPLALAIPTCENAVGAASMRPGEVVQSYRGPTVRIDHTDSEGRLILADGLAYAVDKYKPTQVLSFATLTTSALNSYGPYATPVHFASRELQVGLQSASEDLGEDLHFFPERVWHLEANRDEEADLRNTARLPADARAGAGSRNAAHFLRHFADVPLCHFDIFGSTWNWARDAPGCRYGATGAPMRTLLRYLEVC